MIESLRRRAGRFGLDVILINVWEGDVAAEEALRYCQLWNIDATVLLDAAAEYARAVGVRGVPTNVFVDEHGTIRAVGATKSEELLREAVALVPALRELSDELPGVNRVSDGFAKVPQP